MSKQPKPDATRRKFLTGAAAAAAGAAGLGFPMISRGQTGPITMKWQSTWPSKDIFHEYALDYAKTVNDMTGGDLKIEVLPEMMRAIIANAVDASSQALTWKAIDRYSKDYIEMQTKDKVRFYKTPDSILQKQLEIYDQVVAKKSADNPLFKEIVASQKAFAEHAVKWDMDNNVNRRMAYTHYFGAKAGTAKKA